MVVVRHEKYHLSPTKVRTNDALDLINATFGLMPWVAVDDFKILQMIVGGQEDPLKNPFWQSIFVSFILLYVWESNGSVT